MPSNRLEDYGSFLTISEVAAVMRIGRATAYQYIRDGILPGLHLGRRVVVPRAALEAMTQEANAE